jgi:hypothetical protein
VTENDALRISPVTQYAVRPLCCPATSAFQKP